MEMRGSLGPFPSPEHGTREQNSVKQEMSLRSQNYQHEFSAAARFPWVCHPSTTITNSDPKDMSCRRPL